MKPLIVLIQASGTNSNNAADEFFRYDPSGMAMTIIAMGVVFISLILLYLVFKWISNFYTKKSLRRSLIKEGKHEEARIMEDQSSGELNAAIAMGLYFYSTSLHDFESMKITINKVSRNYSPWSSKIYSMRNWPKN